MNKSLRLVLISLIANIIIFFPITAPSGETDIRTVELENLFSDLQADGSFNGAVQLAQNGKIIFKNSAKINKRYYAKKMMNKISLYI